MYVWILMYARKWKGAVFTFQLLARQCSLTFELHEGSGEKGFEGKDSVLNEEGMRSKDITPGQKANKDIMKELIGVFGNCESNNSDINGIQAFDFV